MVTLEDRVLSLYAETNPVPSVEDLGLIAEEATEYLATLDTRSSEVAHVDTKPEPKTDENRSQAWLIAAVLALVFGAVVVFISQGSPEDDVVTTIVEAAPPTPATPTTVTESPLSGVPVWLGSGEGQFQPSLFSFPFAFTLEDVGWETGVDSKEKFALCGPDVDGPVGARSACFRASAVSVFLLGPETIEDTKTYLKGFPGAEITDEEPVSIDGAEGIRFSFTHNVNPTSNPEGGFGGLPYWLHEAQEIPPGADSSVVSIVDVNGTILTIAYQGRDVTDPTAFVNHLDEGMAIVDSIVWGDLP